MLCRRVLVGAKISFIEMARNRVFFILVMVTVLQLQISPANGSVIKKRSLAEDIKTGINLAGKIFGKWWQSIAWNCVDIRVIHL